ncbi:MAG: hypothetical protein ABEJ36_04190 [Candidatus Nanosalina sp.]
MNRKGNKTISAGVGVVLVIVVGAVVVGGFILPAASQYFSSGGIAVSNGSANVSNMTCVAECREKFPSDRQKFYDCRQSRGCPP